MRVTLSGVSKGKDGGALPVTDVLYASNTATLAIAETEERPTVLGLIASGRMVADTGSVTIDDVADTKSLRRRVALVDAPPVCDPESSATVGGVTIEELMFAGRPSTIPAAKRWLTEHGFGHLARTAIGDLEPRERIALLMELTAMRPEVEGLVLVSPDRHRGEPAEWWTIAQGFAERGYAVLVIAGAAAVRVLRELPEPDSDIEPDVAVAPAIDAEPSAEPGKEVETKVEPDAEIEPRADADADPEPDDHPENPTDHEEEAR
jgi:hypothetical protein